MRSAGELRAGYGPLVGAILVPALAGAVFLPDVPSWFAPLPVVWVFAALIGLPPPLVVGFGYWLVAARTRPQQRMPILTILLIAVLGAADVAWLAASWDLGVRYQGRDHTLVVAVESLAGLLLVAGAAVWSRIQPSRAISQAAWWLLFAWLAWGWLPYLGEMP